MKPFIKLIILIAEITGLITHIWTVIIGFLEGGFWGGLITLFLPIGSEIYWMFKMFGVNNTYSYIVLTQFILIIPILWLSSKVVKDNG